VSSSSEGESSGGGDGAGEVGEVVLGSGGEEMPQKVCLSDLLFFSC
jgi:hypothetical protein